MSDKEGQRKYLSKERLNFCTLGQIHDVLYQGRVGQVRKGWAKLETLSL